MDKCCDNMSKYDNTPDHSKEKQYSGEFCYSDITAYLVGWLSALSTKIKKNT